MEDIKQVGLTFRKYRERAKQGRDGMTFQLAILFDTGRLPEQDLAYLNKYGIDLRDKISANVIEKLETGKTETMLPRAWMVTAIYVFVQIGVMSQEEANEWLAEAGKLPLGSREREEADFLFPPEIGMHNFEPVPQKARGVRAIQERRGFSFIFRFEWVFAVGFFLILLGVFRDQVIQTLRPSPAKTEVSALPATQASTPEPTGTIAATATITPTVTATATATPVPPATNTPFQTRVLLPTMAAALATAMDTPAPEPIKTLPPPYCPEPGVMELGCIVNVDMAALAKNQMEAGTSITITGYLPPLNYSLSGSAKENYLLSMEISRVDPAYIDENWVFTFPLESRVQNTLLVNSRPSFLTVPVPVGLGIEFRINEFIPYFPPETSTPPPTGTATRTPTSLPTATSTATPSPTMEAWKEDLMPFLVSAAKGHFLDVEGKGFDELLTEICDRLYKNALDDGIDQPINEENFTRIPPQILKSLGEEKSGMSMRHQIIMDRINVLENKPILTSEESAELHEIKQNIELSRIIRVTYNATYYPGQPTPTQQAAPIQTAIAIAMSAVPTSTPVPAAMASTPTPTLAPVETGTATPRTGPVWPTVPEPPTPDVERSYEGLIPVAPPPPTVESMFALNPANTVGRTDYSIHDAVYGLIQTRIVKTEIYPDDQTVVWVSVLAADKDYVQQVCFTPCRINYSDGRFAENIGFALEDVPHSGNYHFETGFVMQSAGDPHGNYQLMAFPPHEEIVFGIVFKANREDITQSVEIPLQTAAMRFTEVRIPYIDEATYKSKQAVYDSWHQK